MVQYAYGNVYNTSMHMVSVDDRNGCGWDYIEGEGMKVNARDNWKSQPHGHHKYVCDDHYLSLKTVMYVIGVLGKLYMNILME